MNIRLKFEVSKDGVKIENSGIVIYVERGSVAMNEAGGIPLAAKTGGRDSARITELSALHIACNQDKANKFYYLILLKNILKDSVTDERGNWKVVIKNIDENALQWSKPDNFSNLFFRYHLYLSNGDLLNEKNDLLINPTNIVDSSLINPHNTQNNLDNYKNQLFQLTDFLTKLEDYFIKNNDFDLSSYTSLENDINELQSYVNNAGAGNKGANVKQTIYNIVETKTNPEQILKKKIDNLIDLLKEYRVWSQIIGLKKLTEIKAAKNNGFTIFGKTGSAPTIGIAINSKDLDLNNPNVSSGIKNYFPSPDDKKYKGFLITDPMNYKTLIDRFRDSRFFGGVHNNIDYSKETEPNKCRGFKPLDFLNSDDLPTTYNKQVENMLDKDGQIIGTGVDNFLYSKMVIDAWTAPNIDKAIDLLFYGIPYENMIGKSDERYNPNNNKCLLYFNEIEENGVSKSQILSSYYNALKHYKCGSKANLGKGDWTINNYFNDHSGASNGPKKKVEDNYQKIKEFIETFEKDYNNYQSTKELNEARKKLFNYLLSKNAATYDKITKRWGGKIVSKISEIDVRISTLNNDPVPDNALLNSIKKELEIEIDKNETDKDKRSAMKDRMKDNDIHLLFQAVEIMRKFTEVKGATNKDATKLTELKQLKTDKTSGWEIINKYKHTDGSGYADYRLKLYEDTEEKPKTPEEKEKEFLEKIWNEDFTDEVSFNAKIDNANEINDTEKEKFKNELTPRRKLAKQLESKGDEAKKLIDLLKYFRPDYSRKNLKVKKKRIELEGQLKSLEEYIKGGTSQNSVFTNDLEDSEKEVVKNLIKEIQAKVEEMKKAQEEQPPKGPSSDKPELKGLLIVAVVVLGVVGLIVYFRQRKKDDEELE